MYFDGALSNILAKIRLDFLGKQSIAGGTHGPVERALLLTPPAQRRRGVVLVTADAVASVRRRRWRNLPTRN